MYKELDMNLENFYKERYDAIREENHLLHYKIAYLQGSLKHLKEMIDEVSIDNTDLNMSLLVKYADAKVTSVIEAQKSLDENKAHIEKLISKA